MLKQLVNAEKTGQLPIVLRINTNNEPFYTDSGAGKAGGSGGWHVVTVMDFANGAPAPTPKLMLLKARHLKSEKRYQEAIDLLKLVIAAEPSNVTAYDC